MTFKKILPLLAIATTLVAASGAMAADKSTPPATAAAVQLKGAYAFRDTFKPAKQQYLIVMFKTGGRLERRFDGLVRAGGRLDGVGASIGGVPGTKGNAANHCYTITVKVRDGRLYRGKKASVGSKHTLELSARDADGNEIGDSTTLTIKKRQVGDRSGKPLGC